ncbi:MAG: ATP-binding protein [Saprospiraceae bacterium]|nr:ATP-binding protein [Saprospiraceae bacterium]MCB0626696.1 ATP-binding protein [Saprospiraceae bacterium]MCB0677737.1 ATP-binding protein [Saprospiraceae bacterium]MCB0682628.1 ATP-binding protein [Saprospiraceae bacterium]
MLRRKLSSDPRSVNEVEHFVENLVHKYQLNPDIYGNILVSVTEAVTNAIRHGNRNDHSKTVELELKKCKDKLSFRVSDQGKGFDYRNLPDPTHPDNLLKCGGRGVFLMRTLCDRLRFTNNGSTVEMDFKI